MGEWKEMTVNEISEKICVGFVGTYSNSQTNSIDGYPMIRTTNLTENGIVFQNLTYVTKDFHEKNKKSQLKYGDVLIARHGDNGKACMFKENFEANCLNVVIVRPDKTKVFPLFFLYLFNSPLVRTEISSFSTGSVQDVINTKDIGRLVLSFPSIIEQERIAEVLSSLDDKIDLLHRQNKTLEEMAETLFRQWFVEEAEAGTKPVIYFGKIICGKTPSKGNSNFFNGPIPFLKIPDMHGKTFVFKTGDSLTEAGRNSQSNKTVPPFSISVSCIATVGLVTINAFECQTNQQINSIVPNENYYRYFLYNYFKSITDDLIQRASSGSVTHNLNTGDFSKIDIPYFNEDLFKSYDEFASPLYQKIFQNQIQIQQLETLRDTLLPKLMIGQIICSN